MHRSSIQDIDTTATVVYQNNARSNNLVTTWWLLGDHLVTTWQSVTYWYRDFLIFFGGMGKNWHRKTSPRTGIRKIWSRKRSWNQNQKNLVPMLIFVANFLKFRRVPVLQPGIFFWWHRKNLVPEKVSEPGSVKFGASKKFRNLYRKKFGTGKSTGIVIKNIWYQKKVLVSLSILGTVSRHTLGDHFVTTLWLLGDHLVSTWW